LLLRSDHGYGFCGCHNRHDGDYLDHCDRRYELLRKGQVMGILPDISVLLPARNEGERLASTIRSITRARTTGARIEFVVVDDASTDDSMAALMSKMSDLLELPRVDVRVIQMEEHSGTYRARNEAAAAATGDVLFLTDAHVEFSHGWDRCVLEHIRPDRILAGTVTAKNAAFRGYGASLLVPTMGTTWCIDPGRDLTEVPIAVCAATVISRELFYRLGGYDPEMIHYGGGEPEFSVRAWLEGATICSVRELEVQHAFKERDELYRFLDSVRVFRVHNCIRFGLLYLSELGCMQMLRFYARAFPQVFQRSLALVEKSDLWKRRPQLESRRQRSFAWFVDAFGLRDQVGEAIL
jgi:GT2 family glycosyltransferase